MESEDPPSVIKLEQLLQQILLVPLEENLEAVARHFGEEPGWGIREIPTVDYVLCSLGVSKVVLIQELERTSGDFSLELYEAALCRADGKSPEAKRVLGLAMNATLDYAAAWKPTHVASRDVFILLELSRSDSGVGKMLRNYNVDETSILEVIHKYASARTKESEEQGGFRA